TPDHGLALQTTRYLLFELSKGIEPLQPCMAPFCDPECAIADRVLIGVSDRFSEKDLPLHISSNFPGSHACA
ncbi:hypothetical protein, partial [Burkholderia pseudomallei]